MFSSKSQSSDRLSDWLVIPATTAIIAAVSLGIFAISKSIEVGLGWLIAVFILFLIIQRIDRAKPCGSSIRVGMALGIGVSYVLVRWLWTIGIS